MLHIQLIIVLKSSRQNPRKTMEGEIKYDRYHLGSLLNALYKWKGIFLLPDFVTAKVLNVKPF